MLDTVGFGDPQFDSNFIFGEFKKALQMVNNQIDCVLFVVKKGRFSNEIVKFFEIVQEKVLKGKCRSNSILIVTDCNKGWITKNEQKRNNFIQKALANCNNSYYEFFLDFDNDTDDITDRSRKWKKRQTSINDFITFFNNQHFQKVNLQYVQSQQFEEDWSKNIAPDFMKVLLEMLKEIQEENKRSRTETLNLIKEIQHGGEEQRRQLMQMNAELIKAVSATAKPRSDSSSSSDSQPDTTKLVEKGVPYFMSDFLCLLFHNKLLII